MIFDYIILGGGICGLYTAYNILQREPNAFILILEKDNVLGGRIQTVKNMYMQVESGAARFHSNHKLLLQLLNELDLDKKIGNIDMNITDNLHYQGIYIGSPYKQPMFNVINASKKETAEKLQNLSFYDYAKGIISELELNFIQSSFGYYSELFVMNAKDAIYLIEKQLISKHTFHYLEGGLSQVIDKLSNRILEYKNTKILRNRKITQIETNNAKSFFITCDGFSQKYRANVCISTLPKQIIERIPFCQPLSHLFNKIVCQPLCRIYSKYPVIDGKAWFNDIPRFNVNNNLRMTIPIDKKNGVTMISYTDNKFALFWKRIFNKNGIKGIDDETHRLIKKSLKIDIPKPIKTSVYFWECGVGYWAVGANSAKISKQITKPFSDLDFFICGESFSHKNQQWMEGSLDTSRSVLKEIFL